MCVWFVCKLSEPSEAFPPSKMMGTSRTQSSTVWRWRWVEPHNAQDVFVKPVITVGQKIVAFVAWFYTTRYALVLIMLYCFGVQSVHVQKLFAGGEVGMAGPSWCFHHWESTLDIWYYLILGRKLDHLGSMLWGFRFLLEVGNNETHRRPGSHGVSR